MKHPLRLAAAALVVGVALLGSVAPAASAADVGETPGVVDACAQLTVKPHGYAAKGEVRVTVDGETQTDGAGGWHVFKGSFPGVYVFEPDVAHEWTVQINSYSAGSGGHDFVPGTGGDVELHGPSTACGPVEVAATTTVCAYDWQAHKQSIDLTITALRPHVTYYVEVLDGGDVVTHFQFRDAPTKLKTFSLLEAGTDYVVRVTDQSNDVLSTSVAVPVPGCAARAAVTAEPTVCVGGDASVSLVASDLVRGRDYVAGLTGPAGDVVVERPVHADDVAANVVLSGVAPGTYTPTVRDANAPRLVRGEPVTVSSCDAAATPGGPGSGGTGTDGAGVTGGSTGGSTGGTTDGSTGLVSADGASTGGATGIEPAALDGHHGTVSGAALVARTAAPALTSGGTPVTAILTTALTTADGALGGGTSAVPASGSVEAAPAPRGSEADPFAALSIPAGGGGDVTPTALVGLVVLLAAAAAAMAAVRFRRRGGLGA